MAGRCVLQCAGWPLLTAVLPCCRHRVVSCLFPLPSEPVVQDCVFHHRLQKQVRPGTATSPHALLPVWPSPYPLPSQVSPLPFSCLPRTSRTGISSPHTCTSLQHEGCGLFHRCRRADLQLLLCPGHPARPHRRRHALGRGRAQQPAGPRPQGEHHAAHAAAAAPQRQRAQRREVLPVWLQGHVVRGAAPRSVATPASPLPRPAACCRCIRSHIVEVAAHAQCGHLLPTLSRYV